MTSLSASARESLLREKAERLKARATSAHADGGIDLNLPEPHAAQQNILDHPARHKVACCGRRFGKSDMEVRMLAYGNGPNAKGAMHGMPTAYFSLSYKNVKEVWRRLKRQLAPAIVSKNETDKYMELVGGGTIECWSLTAIDDVRGRKYAGICGDEAAIVPDLQYVVDDVLRATLVDYQGWSFWASTPKGFNYFHKLYMQGLDPTIPDWAAFHYTSYDNPFILASELEAIKPTLPERTWRQEYLAEFIEDGGVFRGVDKVTTLKPAQPMPDHSYVFGVDWGRADDFTVISVIDVTAKQQVAIERFNQINWALQRGRLMTLYEKWKPQVVVAESNSIGEPNIEALKAERLPVRGFQTTPASKGPLVDALSLAIERQLITLLADPIQTAELQAYQMERLPGGSYRYSAPSGGHDDTVIALALAWSAASLPPRIAFEIG